LTTWDGKNRRKKPDRSDGLHADVIEIKNDVKGIFKIINGNGSEGMVVRIDRNTSFRKNINKALWVLFTPLYGGLVALLIKYIIS